MLRSQGSLCPAWCQQSVFLRPRFSCGPRKPLRLLVIANERSRSQKGDSYENKKRRKGRPAWRRSPYDSPLRDGNRDRVIGLLTQRAARTLAYYLSETNQQVYHWLNAFMKANPIPRDGKWDDVSGETFLRKLLSMPIESAKRDFGRDSMYDCSGDIGVDPRNIAQRIMDVRTQLAKEFVQDLQDIAEENALLMRETVTQSFTLSLDNVVDHPMDKSDRQ